MPDPVRDESAPTPPGATLPSSNRPGGLSRHFRKSGDEAPADRRGEAQAEEAGLLDEESEIEELTAQLRELVVKKKARERDRERRESEESGGSKRERMTRSGNLNLSVMVGPGAESAPEDVLASLGDPVKPSPASPTLADPMSKPAPSPNFTGPQPVYFGDSVPPPREISPLVWIVPVAGLLCFGAGYLFGGFASTPGQGGAAAPATASAPGTPGAPAVEPLGAWKETTVAVLDRAMSLDRDGDARGALKLVAELRQSDPNLPGLNRYVAELQTRVGDFAAPEADLSKEIAAGRDLPLSNYLRAFNVARQRRFPDVFKHLQASLLQDPFHADGLYQMAELLRRQGRFADAIIVGKQALLRVRPGYGLAAETIALKLRLAQIENGNAAEVEAQLQETAKTPPLAGDWMLTAAALTLQKGDVPKAVEWLGKARGVMAKEDFENAVDDYFFRNHTTSGPLAEFRLNEAQRIQRTARSWEFFIDP